MENYSLDKKNLQKQLNESLTLDISNENISEKQKKFIKNQNIGFL